MSSSQQIATSFKSRLGKAERMHGFFIGQNSPSLVEMVGYAGFDFVILDQEHGPIGPSALEGLLRAADASNIAALVRVPSPATRDILPVLDMGAAGILVPHITDGSTARKIVEQAHYPPLGKRGVSSLTRAARHGLLPSGDYLSTAGDRVTVLAMIEDADAVQYADEIAATQGIDALFVGPTDLAASLGIMGQRENPKLMQAMEDIVKAAVSSGKPVATTAQTVADVEGLHVRGFSMICHSTTSLMARALRQMHAETR